MDRLSCMATFVATVDHGGFTAAADQLGLSRAAVSKQIKLLEEHLGVRLLNRTTRRVSLTDVGRVYQERCRSILADIDEAESCAGEEAEVPRGRLLVNAPMSFGVHHLGPAVAAYCGAYPQVQVSLDLNDRFVDVVAEGFDVVIRVARMSDSELVARRLAPCRLVTCASPDYLTQFGRPTVPQDLALHRCLVYSHATTGALWTFTGAEGSESVRVNGPVCANNGEILRAAAVAGLGIAMQPTFLAYEEICSGRLEILLADFSPPEVAVYAVYPSRRFLSAKVRTFIDFLSGHFGDEPAWDRAIRENSKNSGAR